MQFALDFGNTPFRPVPRSRASRSLRSPAGLPVKGVTPQNKVRAIPAHRARKEFAPRPEGTFFLSLREANAGERYLPDGMADPGFYRPVDRGLEIRIADKLNELRRRNNQNS